MLLFVPSSLLAFIYIGSINLLGFACYYFLYCECKEIMLDIMTNVSVIQHRCTMYRLLPCQYSSFPCMFYFGCHLAPISTQKYNILQTESWYIESVLAKIYILLINQECAHYREISDWIHQGRGLRDFPVMTKQSRLISYWWYDLFIMDLILGSVKPTTGQRITFKKHVTSMSCQMSLQYSHVTLVSRYPFWQPSVDHNMEVHEDVHYQVNTDCIIMPLTRS